MAEINITPNRYNARICFCRNIKEIADNEIFMIITHELLHIHSDIVFSDVDKMICSCSSDLKRIVNEIVYARLEQMTDALAVSFSNAIGLPESLKG